MTEDLDQRTQKRKKEEGTNKEEKEPSHNTSSGWDFDLDLIE